MVPLGTRPAKREAGAARAEPGTAFAGAEAEAGAFGGRDRGNPETPGPHRGGRGNRDGGSRRRCGSAGAAEPAGSAAWGARCRGARGSSASSWSSRSAGELRALAGCGGRRGRRLRAGVAWGAAEVPGPPGLQPRAAALVQREQMKGRLVLRPGRAGTFWVEEEKVQRRGVWQAVCPQAPDWRAKCLGGQDGGQSSSGLRWSPHRACGRDGSTRRGHGAQEAAGASGDGKGARGKVRARAIGV